MVVGQTYIQEHKVECIPDHGAAFWHAGPSHIVRGRFLCLLSDSICCLDYKRRLIVVMILNVWKNCMRFRRPVKLCFVSFSSFIGHLVLLWGFTLWGLLCQSSPGSKFFCYGKYRQFLTECCDETRLCRNRQLTVLLAIPQMIWVNVIGGGL